MYKRKIWFIVLIIVIGIGNSMLTTHRPEIAPLNQFGEVSEDRLPVVLGNTLIGTEAVRQLEFESLGSFWITGYSSTPEETDDTPFITASNTQVRSGVVACPQYIQFGTYISIDGKSYICEDRMSTKYPHRFDLWFPDKRSARNFGIQFKEVKLIK